MYQELGRAFVQQAINESMTRGDNVVSLGNEHANVKERNACASIAFTRRAALVNNAPRKLVIARVRSYQRKYLKYTKRTKIFYVK